MGRKARIDQDSKDWNQSTTSFLVCSSTLSFVSILESVLHSISSYFKSYDHCSIIEMIFNKLHIVIEIQYVVY